jgi:Skp family chaperone for outer membrane proteins
MKNVLKYLLVAFLFINSSYAMAEQKIVILDLKLLLNTSKAGSGAQDFLKKSYAQNVKKFTGVEKDLKKEENDLLKKKTVLSKEEYKKKSDALRKKVISYQSERRVAFDKIATQRSKSREMLIKKINPILNTYMKENSVTLVVDKKNVLGGIPEVDITNFIMKQLDKELPSLNLK